MGFARAQPILVLARYESLRGRRNRSLRGRRLRRSRHHCHHVVDHMAQEAKTLFLGSEI